MKPSGVAFRYKSMNVIHKHLVRAMATLLVAIPLAGCSTPSQPTPNAEAVAPTMPLSPTINVTPTGAVKVLPTPTPLPASEPAATVLATTVPAEPTAATVPSLDDSWTQESYGDAWTIAYPTGWTVNAAGANEGALQLQGDYEGHSYAVTYNYPIGLAASLEAWVEEALLPLTLKAREAVVMNDVTVANTPAKKVLNVPTPDGTSSAHVVYIWRTETKNPRIITITQTDGQPVDAVAMDQLLDRLLIPVQ